MTGIGLFSAVALLGCAREPASLSEVETLQNAGRHAETLESLRLHLSETPEDRRAQFLYGRALWAMGRPGLAIWALRSAMEDPEYLLSAGSLLVNTLILGEAWGDAREICDEMLAALGENADVLTLRAYARQGSRLDYEGAIEDADRALELDPENYSVLIPRTVSLLALNRVEEAGDALRRLDELFRNGELGVEGSGKFCTAGATFAYEKGEIELARERFERCLDEFPDNPILLPKALEFFDGLAEHQRSIAILERALEVEPEAAEIRENLALRLEAAGRRDEALRVLRAALDHPSEVAQVQAWSMLGSFHAQTGRVDEAIRAYEEARKRLTTRSPSLELRYADLLIHGERHEEALEFAKQLEVEPHRFLVEGRALLALDRPVEALERLTEANRLWPNNAVARYYTAVAAEQVWQLERAIEEYRYSVRIESAATDAPMRLASYHLAQGRVPRAVNALSLGRNGHPDALAMQLMVARIMAYGGQWKQVPKAFATSLMIPPYRGRAVAAIADGVRERHGSETALELLLGVEGMDWEAPQSAPALERLVAWLVETGRGDDALARARAAREAAPDVAAFEAIYAFALAQGVENERSARAAYERALELDPEHVLALRGLASLLASEELRGDRREDADPAGGERAEHIVRLYRKAIEVDPRDARASRRLASFLESSGRQREAVRVLEDLLKRRPWDPEASLDLAETLLDLRDGTARARAHELVDWADKLRAGSRGLEARFQALTRRLEEESGARAL